MKKVLLQVKDWLAARLSEKTTWGIIITGITTILGVQIAPSIADNITVAGMAIASIIGAASTEHPK